MNKNRIGSAPHVSALCGISMICRRSGGPPRKPAPTTAAPGSLGRRGDFPVRRLRHAGAALAALLAVARPAFAAPPSAPGTGAIVTLQLEDSGLTGNDRYYAAGGRLSWTSPADQVPDPLGRLGHALWGAGVQRISLGLSQRIYTPHATQLSVPPPTDRPYAGLLLGHLALIEDGAAGRNSLSLSLGVIGPAALAEEIQNGVHGVIGQNSNKGWGSQLPNQPVLEVQAAHVWRFRLGHAGPIAFDVLPSVAAGVGTWRIYAQAGALIRLGQGLGSDYGPARLAPGLSGGTAYTPTRRFAWYVFVGADGQAVAWDETLQGEPFRSTAHVGLEPLVGEAEIGVAVIVHGVRASLTHVVQTATFRTQSAGLVQFDSLAVAIPF